MGRARLWVVPGMSVHVFYGNPGSLEAPCHCPDLPFSRRAKGTWVDTVWTNVMTSVTLIWVIVTCRTRKRWWLCKTHFCVQNPSPWAHVGASCRKKAVWWKDGSRSSQVLLPRSWSMVLLLHCPGVTVQCIHSHFYVNWKILKNLSWQTNLLFF